MADNASHALASSATVKLTFNIEEEFVAIRNGWTPKEDDFEVNSATFIFIDLRYWSLSIFWSFICQIVLLAA